MKKYLLPENGTFYKANLHCHTTFSDGIMTPEEVKERYMKNGYSVVAFTDHDVLIGHQELKSDDFLPLNGCELGSTQQVEGDIRTRKDCHMCFIALSPDNVKQICFHREYKYAIKNKDIIEFDESKPDFDLTYCPETITNMMKTGRDNGFFVIYNHPAWNLENYSDYMNYNYMHAMEIYNHGSFSNGYPEYNEKEYDDMLRGDKRIYCVATDDNHLDNDCCGGFTMIKAEKLEYQTVTDALLKGDFFASNGPLIHDLWFEDGKVFVSCSDAKSIKINTGVRCAGKVTAPDGEVLNNATFSVSPGDKYIRITVVDEQGKCANTNAYFTDELFL